jgi:hypothetical protein
MWYLPRFIQEFFYFYGEKKLISLLRFVILYLILCKHYNFHLSFWNFSLKMKSTITQYSLYILAIPQYCWNVCNNLIICTYFMWLFLLPVDFIFKEKFQKLRWKLTFYYYYFKFWLIFFLSSQIYFFYIYCQVLCIVKHHCSIKVQYVYSVMCK